MPNHPLDLDKPIQYGCPFMLCSLAPWPRTLSYCRGWWWRGCCAPWPRTLSCSGGWWWSRCCAPWPRRIEYPPCHPLAAISKPTLVRRRRDLSRKVARNLCWNKLLTKRRPAYQSYGRGKVFTFRPRSSIQTFASKRS